MTSLHNYKYYKPAGCRYTISNPLKISYDQIIIIIKYISTNTKTTIIKVYNASTKQWNEIDVSSHELEDNQFALINDISQVQESKQNPLIVAGFIRNIIQNFPYDLVSLCFKYFNSADIRFCFTYIVGDLKIGFVEIVNGNVTKLCDRVLGAVKSAAYTINVKDKYHIFTSQSHYKWDPQKSGSKMKVVKQLRLTSHFDVKGFVYINRYDMMLLMVQYDGAGGQRGGCNTIWRFDSEKKRWKRLKDLDLEYPLDGISYDVTPDERYLMVTGSVNLLTDKRILILDLEPMEWMDVNVKLDVQTRGKLNMSILSDGDVHLFSTNDIDGHYVFNVSDIFHSNMNFDAILDWNKRI